MRKAPNLKAEKFRVRRGGMQSFTEDGNNGCFIYPCLIDNRLVVLNCIVSDGGGWDHVSVSIADQVKSRCPTWEEMCAVKELFFADDEVVMQLHPAKEKYVNDHKFTLHLWRPHTQRVPTPPEAMVGREPSLPETMGPNYLVPVTDEQQAMIDNYACEPEKIVQHWIELGFREDKRAKERELAPRA